MRPVGCEDNLDKTVFLPITNKRNPFLFSYSIKDSLNPEVDQFKYLGVTINKTLNRSDHVNNVFSGAFRKLGLVRHKLKNAPLNVKMLAYASLIRPKVQYCAIVLDQSTKKHSDILEKVQRRAVRFVYGKFKRTDSSSLQMQTKNIRTLQHRRKIARLKFLRQLFNSKVSLNSCSSVSPVSTRQTRHNHRYFLTPYFARTNTFKFSYFPRTITEWNSLTLELFSSPDLASSLESFYLS